MVPKDLEREARPENPPADLAEAAKPRPVNGPLRQLGEWWRSLNKPAVDATQLGWDGNQLEKARTQHPEKPEKQQPKTAEQIAKDDARLLNEREVLKALARRYGKLAGKSQAAIQQDINDALAAADEATEAGQGLSHHHDNKPRKGLARRVAILLGASDDQPDMQQLELLVNGRVIGANDSDPGAEHPIPSAGIKPQDKTAAPPRPGG